MLTKSSSPPAKRAKTRNDDDDTPASTSSAAPPYELYYWPTIPGRAEYIRLCFEATNTPFTEVTNPFTSKSPPNLGPMMALLTEDKATESGTSISPPALYPPILKHGDVLLNQTGNILMYLGGRLGLAGGSGERNQHGNEDRNDEARIHAINQLALAVLHGFTDEAHDVHHPISTTLAYEDQKVEARRRSHYYVTYRLPKFLAYFERVLKSPSSSPGGSAEGGGEWLYGGKMTYADLVLWQGMDGVKAAFPKAMGAFKVNGDYVKVFEHHDRVAGVEYVKKYLESGRRKGYGMGIWRWYEELDVLPGEVEDW